MFMPFPQQLRHERVSPSTVTETGCSLPVETMNKHMKSWLLSRARQTATAAILQQWQTEEASPSVTTDDSIREPREQQTPKQKRQSSLSREAMRAESLQGGEQRGGSAQGVAGSSDCAERWQLVNPGKDQELGRGAQSI